MFKCTAGGIGLREHAKDVFQHKTVFITGATSDIGAAIAESFAALGADLLLSDHPDLKKRLNEMAGTFQHEYASHSTVHPIDLNSVDEIQANLSSIEKPIDILVNCAGLNTFLPALKVEEEVWDQILNVNLKSLFFVSKFVAETMIKSRTPGKIVNLASQHGVVANGLRAPYCASKAGVIHLTKVLALEWSQYDILVNCVSPTFTKTSKSETFLQHPNVQKSFLPKIPLKRFATPNDITRAVLFLSSPFNTMITGENILVDGGYTIH